MTENFLNNCFILGAVSGLVAMLVLYLHKKYVDEKESDKNLYIKIFLLSSVLSCLAVFMSQQAFNTNKSKNIMLGGASQNIHTGASPF